MNDAVLKEYGQMAVSMESLRRSALARPGYHLLADAIYWSDEIPAVLPPFAENCLRIILRYRTTLILGAAEAKWRPYWEEARRRFPSWIGFDETRADPKLQELYLKLKTEAENGSFWGTPDSRTDDA